MKGGSWISTGNESTKFSRYAFRRHFFQHAGFRYIQSNENINVSDINYESDTQVSQYSEFHFGDSYFQVPNFAKKSADICIEMMKINTKALDLGCAVGRTSFELARVFDHVDGVDFSARFIKVAMELQEREEIRYLLKEEGDLNSFKTRNLKTMGLAEFKNKVSFYQGDACNLKANFTNYDLIFMGNLIDRLYDPKKLLQEIHERLNIGGILIIASPYTWLEEYTKKENWLGGFKETNGETLTTEKSIERILITGGHFKKVVKSFEVEFIIRETKRKFQHSLSEFNVFERIV
jgi:putative 4-mercaptohistidine N1-methyltranferase